MSVELPLKKPKGAQKGHPKWGGRKKGVPNRNKVLARDEIEAYLGMSLAQKLMETIMEIRNPKDRAVCMSLLLQYCYPKLDAVAIQIENKTDTNNGTNEQAIKFVEAVVTGSDRPGCDVSTEGAIQTGLIPVREGLPGVQGS